MLEEGVLDGPNGPDSVFALHIDTSMPVGSTASRGGTILASANVWTIDLKGQGGHASMPFDTLDPIPVACEIVQALQTFVTRRVRTFDPQKHRPKIHTRVSEH